LLFNIYVYLIQHTFGKPLKFVTSVFIISSPEPNYCHHNPSVVVGVVR